MESILFNGVYSVPEASRLAKIHSRTINRWITGDGTKRRGKLLHTDLPTVRNRKAVSFLDLIDLLVVGRFREAGVPLQTIRRVYDRLGGAFDTTHPFSHRQLLTDGKTIFMESLDSLGDHDLEEVVSGQKAMTKVLEPYLRQIEYKTETSKAARWNIHKGVVIDPERSFGKPTVETEGTTTHILSRAYWANNENLDLVADLYNVSPEAVIVAVEFESEYFPQQAA